MRQSLQQRVGMGNREFLGREGVVAGALRVSAPRRVSEASRSSVRPRFFMYSETFMHPLFLIVLPFFDFLWRLVDI